MTTLIPTPGDVQQAWDDARAKEKRERDEAEKDDRAAVEELVAKERDELVETMTADVCKRLREDCQSPTYRSIFVKWPKHYFCSADVSMPLHRAGTRMTIYKCLLVGLFQSDVIPKFQKRGWGVTVTSTNQGGLDIYISNNEAPIK